MTDEKSLPETMTQVFELLKPLASDDRKRVVAAALTMLGDAPMPSGASGNGAGTGGEDSDLSSLPEAARRWMNKNKVTMEQLEQSFYFDNGKVEITTGTMPASDKRGGTIQAYLLCGIKSLLESGTASFTDSDAMALCKHAGVYDKNNHTTTRNMLGNRVTGSKEKGFVLAAPGLIEAAQVVQECAK